MRTLFNLGVLFICLFNFPCFGQLQEQNLKTLISNENHTKMKPSIAIFEIPATNTNRAIQFYENILNISIEKMEMQGMEMGIFPIIEGEAVWVIMKADGLTPSENGITLYIDAGNDLQPMLNNIKANGGKVLVPKTPHADESGFFALFLDSEGNRLGLHSNN